MNKGDKEAASSRDAGGGSLPAEGAAQAGDSGRRWLSRDEDSQVHAAGTEGWRVKVGTDPAQSSREPDGGGPRFGAVPLS